jgi:4-amino-4-deoxy-L-arabinose transferase-like glycosyltransferase
MKRFADPWAWALCAIAVCTRLPFVPSTLYDFDAAAFAEAIQTFDPLRFHPHPPGYTFYVVATKLIHALGVGPSFALCLASVFASAATTCAIYGFGKALGGRGVGLIASGMFLASPLAWTYGAVQGTYEFGALGATSVAYLAWRRLEGDAIRPAWLGLAAAVAAGFRPDTAVVLTPLLSISCALAPSSSGWPRRLASVAEGALAGLAGLALWIVPAASASGSIGGYRAAVLRQWEAVAFSNAQDHFSSLAFHGINVVKVGVYGGAALGPVGAIAFLLALRTVSRRTSLTPATKVTLWGWLLGYAGLAVGVAFGQPGMLLTALPAACLTIGLGFSDPHAESNVRRSVPIVAIVCSSLFFLAAPLLSPRGFFDAGASLPVKLSTELLLFTRPGIRLVDRELGAALDRLRAAYPSNQTVVLTNVASSTRAMWALPHHRVACYFAFAGFGAPIPSHDVGEPSGTWSLPPGTRWLALLDADRHSLAVTDQVGGRVSVGTATPDLDPRQPHPTLRVFDLQGAWAIRFRSGRIEAIGGSGLREATPS